MHWKLSPTTQISRSSSPSQENPPGINQSINHTILIKRRREYLQGERVHVRPEREDGPGPSAVAAGDGGDDAGAGDGPLVGDPDRVELGADELAGADLLERQLGVPVDPPPHAAQPLGHPRLARRRQEVVIPRRRRPRRRRGESAAAGQAEEEGDAACGGGGMSRHGGGGG